MELNPEKLVQIEIPVADLGLAQQFYASAFGWRAVPAEIHNYVVLDVPSSCPWGISLVPSIRRNLDTGAQDRQPSIVLFFAAPNPSEICEKVRAAGGTVKENTRQLPGYGTAWFVTDIDGNSFGLFKPLE